MLSCSLGEVAAGSQTAGREPEPERIRGWEKGEAENRNRAAEKNIHKCQ